MKWAKKLIPQKWMSILAILTFMITANTVINTEKIAEKWYSLVRYDQGGYYSYLPGTFIYQDYDLDFYTKLGFKSDFIMMPHPSGKKLNRYSTGPAVLFSPFYYAGHIVAKNSPKYNTSGFSPPYKKAVLFGALFYVSLALFMLRFVLLQYYDDIVVALTLLTIGIGTNLLYYSTMKCMLSHTPSFFLYSLLLWSTIKWLDYSKKKYLLLIGLTMGLIAATRLPNLAVGLIPLLWGIRETKDIKTRLALLWEQKLWIIAAFLLCILGYSPQAIYCKFQVGSFFVNSYPNSKFWFEQPLPHRVMFSFRNGWLIYSPLMTLGLTGFFLIKKHCSAAFLPLLSFFIINLYVISSWWCWWYGGSFGMRALIETSALLSLTIAASINFLIHGKISKYLFILLFPCFIGLNILQTHQYIYQIIRFDGMNWPAYKLVFGKTNPVTKELLDERTKLINYRTDFNRAVRDKKYRYEFCK